MWSKNQLKSSKTTEILDFRLKLKNVSGLIKASEIMSSVWNYVQLLSTNVRNNKTVLETTWILYFGLKSTNTKTLELADQEKYLQMHYLQARWDSGNLLPHIGQK